MPGTVQFIAAQVSHARLRPRRNKFRYGVPYVAVPAEALGRASRHGLLAIEAANLFSVRSRDYGAAGVAPAAWVRSILARWRVREADGAIVLVTMPRVLGLAFNPVSFWLCFDAASGLRAVVCEVNNTFGERHFYLCCHDDHRVIAPGDSLANDKVFHVSPFMKVEGHYRFSFAWNEGVFGARIDLHDGDGLILTTSVAGRREAVTSGRLVGAFFANPFLMLKVLGLIHYQAARLFLKGVTAFGKPRPPASSVSR